MVALVALWLANPVGRLLESSGEREGLTSRIIDYEERLSSLPEAVSGLPVEGPDEDVTVLQEQQALSSTLRGYGGRLLELSALEAADFEGVRALRWQATFLGDPISIKETLNALTREGLLLNDIEITRSGTAGLETLNVRLTLYLVTVDMGTIQTKADSDSFLKRYPFLADRSEYARIETIEDAPQVQETITLVGIRKRGGEWVATLSLSDGRLLTFGNGDRVEGLAVSVTSNEVVLGDGESARRLGGVFAN